MNNKWSQLKQSGHFPTLVSSFLYFDYSFMVWTLLGVLGVQIAAPSSLNLSPQEKYFMVSVPILSGGVLRIVLGLLVGLVGCGGGLGGFLLANMMGLSRQHTGSYLTGLLIFAGLCILALSGLSMVKRRWRTTWGALAQARI